MMMVQSTIDNQRGLATVETTVRLVAVVAALLGIMVYVQRAMQGHVFAGARSIGRQQVNFKAVGLDFDSVGTYRETQTLTQLTQNTKQQTMRAMVDAPLTCTDRFDSVNCLAPSSPAKAGEDPNMWLWSLPSGPVPREPAARQSRATSDSNVGRNGTYTLPR